MKQLFRFFAERHLLAHLLTIMIIMLGLSTAMVINRSQFPKVEFGEMWISTSYPGASPEDVELNVTNKIEDELKSVVGIKRTSSISMESISFIQVVIEPDVSDENDVIDEVRQAVGRVTDLPSEVTEFPLITEIKTSIFPILEIGVSGDLTYPELREFIRLFEKKLKDIPGISRIKKYGYLNREVKVEVSLSKLNEYGIPIREIISAIQERNIRATGGSLESYTSEKNVVTLAQFRNPAEVGNVIVRSTFSGPQIKVSDLAKVNDEFEEKTILTRINRKPVISFVIEKSESADIVRTSDAVKALIERERQNMPDEIEFLYTEDVAKYVRNQFQIVRMNGLIGLVLVLIVLTIFLNLRTAFWVSMGIPITVLGVICLLPVFDVDLDRVTLSALIIVMGIIVDDAIIISENIYRKREAGASPLESAVDGINEVFRPVITTILTTFIAFAPMFFMPGILGKFVYVIPLTISLALFISLFEVVVALPAHIMSGMRDRMKGEIQSDEKRWFLFIKDHFKHFLHYILTLRYLFISIAVVIFLCAIFYAVNYMSIILFPSKGADRIIARIELPTGTSLQATSDKMKEIEAMVERLPEEEVVSYLVRIGAFTDIVDTESENYATLVISLTPYNKRSRTADQIVRELREKTDRKEGFKSIIYAVDAGGPPIGKPVMIRVLGSDDSLRTHLANDVESFLYNLKGVNDIDRDDKPGKEQVEIIIDYEKLARLDMTVAQIAQTVRLAYDGEVVTSVRYGEEDVDFRVLLEKSTRQNLNLIYDLPVPNKTGKLISLSNVIELKIGPSPSSFHHYNRERSITITSNVDQEITTSLEVTNTVLTHFNLEKDYPGIRFVVGGEAQESQDSIIGLISTLLIAVLGIYFLLILLFNSITQPFLILIAIPFGIIGIIFAFALHGESLGFLAMIGSLGMTGVVVNDSLVLVNYLNKLRLEKPNENIVTIVTQGTSERLRAITLTTLSTVFGLLPLAYGLGGTDVYMAPMALALGYGILFATPLTLALIPCLYVIAYDLRGILKK